MANILSRLLGHTKQENAANDALVMQQKSLEQAKKERQSVLDRMKQAVLNNPYPTYLSTSPAQEYQKTLQDRMAGKGLIDVNAETAPYATQRRSGLEKENAVISSAASARGLGRSTIPVSQIGQASQAAERDIAERMSDLELARQEQIGTAVNQYGGVAANEANSQVGRVNYNVGNEGDLSNLELGISGKNQTDTNSIGNLIKQNGAEAAANQLVRFEMVKQGILAAVSAGAGGAGGASGIAGAEGLSYSKIPGLSNGLQNEFAIQDAKRNLSLVNR